MDLGVDNVSILPLEAIADLGQVILFLKAIGVAALVYFIYMIVMAVLNFKKLKRLGIIETKINSLGKKVDKLLEKR